MLESTSVDTRCEVLWLAKLMCAGLALASSTRSFRLLAGTSLLIVNQRSGFHHAHPRRGHEDWPQGHPASTRSCWMHWGESAGCPAGHGRSRARRDEGVVPGAVLQGAYADVRGGVAGVSRECGAPAGRCVQWRKADVLVVFTHVFFHLPNACSFVGALFEWRRVRGHKGDFWNQRRAVKRPFGRHRARWLGDGSQDFGRVRQRGPGNATGIRWRRQRAWQCVSVAPDR